MAEKSEQCRVSLKVTSRESIKAVVYKLNNIPNFFQMPEYDGTRFDSPTFEFADATWHFQFYSAETWRKTDGTKECYRCFNVGLVRLSSEIPEHFIFSRVAILDADDEELESNCVPDFCIPHFKKEGEKSGDIAHFHNEDQWYDKCDSLVLTLFIQLFLGRSALEDAEEDMSRGLLKEKEEEEGCKVRLRVLSSKKKLPSVTLKMKIPNFFVYERNPVASEVFAFVNAAWRFRFYSRPEVRHGVKQFAIALARLDSEIPDHFIFSAITLLKENNEEYAVTAAWIVMDGDGEGELYFDNEISGFDRRDSLTLIIQILCDNSINVEPSLLQNDFERDSEWLSRDFKKLLLKGKNRDFTLRVAGKEFSVHRDVLMARSPVFDAMLSHDMSEKNDGFIEVPDCDPKAMEQFLFYVYSGKVVNLNEENMLEVYYIADKYDVPLLKRQCAEFMKKSLSPTIICGVMQLALNHSDTDLLLPAIEYFLSNQRQILPTVEWTSFVKSNPTITYYIKSYSPSPIAHCAARIQQPNPYSSNHTMDKLAGVK